MRDINGESNSKRYLGSEPKATRQISASDRVLPTEIVWKKVWERVILVANL